MASSIGTVTVEISNYFESTRAIRCISHDCYYFRKLDGDYLGCGLKEITIGRAGLCEQYTLTQDPPPERSGV